MLDFGGVTIHYSTIANASEPRQSFGSMPPHLGLRKIDRFVVRWCHYQKPTEYNDLRFIKFVLAKCEDKFFIHQNFSPPINWLARKVGNEGMNPSTLEFIGDS